MIADAEQRGDITPGKATDDRNDYNFYTFSFSCIFICAVCVCRVPFT